MDWLRDAARHLTEIVQGIAAIDKLHTCDPC